MRFLFFAFIITFLFEGCSGVPEIAPEQVIEEFIVNSNEGKRIDEFITEDSKEIAGDFQASRKFTEKYSIKTGDCKIKEEEAVCKCLTASGKRRNFTLIKSDDGNWKINLQDPEVIVELFHLFYVNGQIDQAIKYATATEKDRLKVFKELVAEMTLDESLNAIEPFDLKCEKFKKKYECRCISGSGETNYVIYHTSKGWKAELGQSSVFSNDDIIDYNSPEDFNLNQHDLDSLTDFSQKMLDSMLNQ